MCNGPSVSAVPLCVAADSHLRCCFHVAQVEAAKKVTEMCMTRIEEIKKITMDVCR